MEKHALVTEPICLDMAIACCQEEPGISSSAKLDEGHDGRLAWLQKQLNSAYVTPCDHPFILRSCQSELLMNENNYD